MFFNRQNNCAPKAPPTHLHFSHALDPIKFLPLFRLNACGREEALESSPKDSYTFNPQYMQTRYRKKIHF